MRNLKDILEGIMDRGNRQAVGQVTVQNEILDFIEKNYRLGGLGTANEKLTFREERTSDGKYIVDGPNFIVSLMNKELDSLTNGMFVWGSVRFFDCAFGKIKSLEGSPLKCVGFACNNCNNLITLEGAPQECDNFTCSRCESLKSLKGSPQHCWQYGCIGCISLTSLEGGPQTTRETFDCSGCHKLKNLKGAPYKVGYSPMMTDGAFNCDNCKGLVSLEGAPEYCLMFDCSECPKLKSLKGAPKKVKYNFDCDACKNLVDISDGPECETFSCKNCKNLMDVSPILDKCKKLDY